jgi:hypothetical protein
MWPNYFHNDPPNAVLSIKTSNIKDNRAIKQQGGVSPAIVPISLVLTLSNPHLAADQKSVTYDAKRIFKSTADATKLPYKKPTVLVLATPKTFGTAVLNVNNGHIHCPTTSNSATKTNSMVTHGNASAIKACATMYGNLCQIPTLFNHAHCSQNP